MKEEYTILSEISCPDSAGFHIENNKLIITNPFCKRLNRSIPNFPEIPSWCPRLQKQPHIQQNKSFQTEEHTVEYTSLSDREVFSFGKDYARMIETRAGMQFLSSTAKIIVDTLLNSNDIMDEFGYLTKNSVQIFFAKKWNKRKAHKAVNEICQFVNENIF